MLIQQNGFQLIGELLPYSLVLLLLSDGDTENISMILAGRGGSRERKGLPFTGSKRNEQIVEVNVIA